MTICHKISVRRTSSSPLGELHKSTYILCEFFCDRRFDRSVRFFIGQVRAAATAAVRMFDVHANPSFVTSLPRGYNFFLSLKVGENLPRRSLNPLTAAPAVLTFPIAFILSPCVVPKVLDEHYIYRRTTKGIRIYTNHSQLVSFE